MNSQGWYQGMEGWGICKNQTSKSNLQKSSDPNPAWQKSSTENVKNPQPDTVTVPGIVGHGQRSREVSVVRWSLLLLFSPVFNFICLEPRCVVWEINGVMLPLSLTPFTLKPHACTPLSLSHLISLWKPSLVINPQSLGALLCFPCLVFGRYDKNCSR